MNKFRKSYTEITTADTLEVYTYPRQDDLQIWEAQITIACLDGNGRPVHHGPARATVYLTRETLEDAGLLPWSDKRTEPKPKKKPETAEDLLLRLLEHVGVYPEE